MIRTAIYFIAGSLFLASLSAEPPTSIKIGGSSDAVPISSSVIPIPVEIFAALEKLGHHDWGSKLEQREYSPSPDLSRSALLFGLAISQGFMAVQAEDSREVLRIGQAVQRLAEPLGVNKAVEGRMKIIIESLHSEDWDDVKQEFDKTRQTVLQTMIKTRDEDLATLVALGGWLGGTETLSAILVDDYSAESSDLLNQAGLLNQLKRDFDQLPAHLKSQDILEKTGSVLDNLRELMRSDSSGAVSLAQVTRIHRETSELVEAIYSN